MCVSECTCCKNNPAKRTYVDVQVEGDRATKRLKVIVDTGNTLRAGVAISKKLHQQLGVGFKRLKKESIGTAAQGKGMMSMGYSNEVKLRIQGIQGCIFTIHPMVISGMVDDMNIGSFFLQRAQASIQFGDEKSFLRIGDKRTELIRVVRDLGNEPGKGTEATEPQVEGEVREEVPESQEGHKPRSPVREARGTRARETSCGVVHVLKATKDMECQPDHLTFIPIARQKGMIRVYPTSSQEGEEAQPIRALYQNTQKIAVLNLGEKKIVRKGEVIGQFTYVIHKPGKEPDQGIQEVAPELSQGENEKVLQLWTDLGLDENEMLRRDPM